ncbi:MAG: hypothetical protein IKK03_14625 [Lachnospiraceae bacterium]|nr:hypothetical protein [Lachnospiraceae bacterium]
MKKTFLKRLLSLAVASTMLAGCMTGCGQEANNDVTTESKVESAATESTVESTVVPEEPVELTMWAKFSSTELKDMGEMEFLQIMEENANVDITYAHPSADAINEQFSLKVAGNNWEDMVMYDWSKYPGGTTQAINDGIIIDIAPYMEEYAPNFAAYLEANPDIAKQIINEEGQIYGFPCIGEPSSAVTAGYSVRKDWLDKLNMNAPETISDWEAMLTAFKQQMGATKPFTLTQTYLFKTNFFAGAWGIATTYYLDNGVVKYGYAEPAAKDFVATMADWYQKGLIDNECFGSSDKIGRANVLSNDSGAIFGFVASCIGTIMDSAKEANPELDMVAVQYPVLNEGETNLYIRRTAEVRTEGTVCITSKCKEIEAAMRYLDQFYSEEGIIAKNFGVEGLTYEMVNGEPVYTDLILNNPDGLSISDALTRYTQASSPSVGIIDGRYYEQYYVMEQQKDAFILWNENSAEAVSFLYPTAAVTTPEEAEELTSIVTPLETYVYEEVAKFITGDRSMDDWDNFVTQMKSMNLSRAIEIKQAAYDRYVGK